MTKLKLNGDYKFGFEPYDKGIRLVVFKNYAEHVCRKETIKNLEQFIQSDQSRIFKGRLQLYKQRKNINVEVKGETIGIIYLDDFKKSLGKINSQKNR